MNPVIEWLAIFSIFIGCVIVTPANKPLIAVTWAALAMLWVVVGLIEMTFKVFA